MEPKKTKPITYILLIIAALLAGVVYIPAFAGVWRIIAGEENIPSAFPSIQLAILATALGAVTLLLAHRPPDSNKVASGNQREVPILECEGKFLLFSAFCFTIFGLLAPILPAEPITGSISYEMITKWIAVISLMLGTASLTVAVCFAMVFIWVRKL